MTRCGRGQRVSRATRCTEALEEQEEDEKGTHPPPSPPPPPPGGHTLVSGRLEAPVRAVELRDLA